MINLNNCQLNDGNTNQYPATLFHMTHINNLPSILAHGLFAHGNKHQREDISNRSVNNRRAYIIEPFYNRRIHDYVPFYFNPRNAMLYSAQKNYPDNIILLSIDSDIVHEKNTLFTDSNAATNDVQIYKDVADFDKLDWNLIFSTSWYGYGTHVKQAMMAEVLIYKHLEVNKIETIYCQNHFVTKKLKKQLATPSIQISTDPSLFLRGI